MIKLLPLFLYLISLNSYANIISIEGGGFWPVTGSPLINIYATLSSSSPDLNPNNINGINIGEYELESLTVTLQKTLSIDKEIISLIGGSDSRLIITDNGVVSFEGSFDSNFNSLWGGDQALLFDFNFEFENIHSDQLSALVQPLELTSSSAYISTLIGAYSSQVWNDSFKVTYTVPTPTTLLLFIIGFFGLGLSQWNRIQRVDIINK